MNKRTFRRWLQSVIAVFLSASLLMSGCAGAGSGSGSDEAAEEARGESGDVSDEEPGEESGEEPGEASDTDGKSYKDDGVDYSRAMAQRSQSSRILIPRSSRKIRREDHPANPGRS